MNDEPNAVVQRYARRTAPGRYSLLQPDVWQTVQERQRALLRRFAQAGWHELDERRLVEVGCGAGGNLLEALRMGFRPQHLTGIELLPERLARAREVLPAGVTLLEGDASVAPLPAGSADLVLQATVFSSLLDAPFRHQLAQAMWSWLRPGGAVLWYDLRVDNPRNPDVRGLPLHELRQLFPAARIEAERITLAPPIARLACRVHPALYGALNLLPPLRSHLLAWIEKPGP